MRYLRDTSGYMKVATARGRELTRIGVSYFPHENFEVCFVITLNRELCEV